MEFTRRVDSFDMKNGLWPKLWPKPTGFGRFRARSCECSEFLSQAFTVICMPVPVGAEDQEFPGGQEVAGSSPVAPTA